VAHLHFFQRKDQRKKNPKEPPSQRTDTLQTWSDTTTDEKALLVTRVWQKWRFSAPQTHLWLIKVWFSASTFVVKIATFAKPETVTCNQPTEKLNFNFRHKTSFRPH